MILNEIDMLKLPPHFKKILIDYMNELSTEDKIKVIKHQNYFIHEIINKENMRHVYMLNNGSERINDAIKQSKVPFSELDNITNPVLHKYAFQSEYCLVKTLFGEHLPEFHSVIYHSSDVYNYGYGDLSLTLKLTRVAQAVDALMKSGKSYSTKSMGVINAVEVLCSYYIKANSEIKKVLLFTMTNKFISNEDPFIFLFNQFINSSKPKYEIAEKMVTLLIERINPQMKLDQVGEEIYDHIHVYLTIILRMFSYYCRIKDTAMKTYDVINGRRAYFYIIDEFKMPDDMSCKNYLYNGPTKFKPDEHEMKGLIERAVDLYNYTKEHEENISFVLSEKELSAILYETQNEGHITLLFEENQSLPNSMIVLSKMNEIGSINHFLLFKETSTKEKSYSQIMGISLNKNDGNEKNKIIFEDLDIYSEYEIDFKN